ncbi:MAG: hypothetical protein JST80_10025 [Bdellovibrionales bacterium]|nr:hypothetical protein [Bdellovibrionales bacterium]
MSKALPSGRAIRATLALAILVAGFVCGPAFAKTTKNNPIEWSFHGKAFTDQYIYTQGPYQGELLQSSLSFWPEVEAKINDQWSAKGVLAANLFFKSLNDLNNVIGKADVREAYLTYQKPGWEIRAGQLIIPWGKSDGINPTDYFTAKDYTFYVPDDELRRRGDLSLSVSFTPKKGDSPWNLQAVFQARYPQIHLLIPDTTLPAGLTLVKDAPDSRYFNPEDVQGGARLQYLGTSFDFSISAFRGTSAFPEYQLNQVANTIQAFHTQETAFGSDASFNVGESSVVRIETALHMPDNGTDSDVSFGLVEPWHWDTVIGIERPVFMDFRVTAQFLVRHHLYYKDPLTFNDGNPVSSAIQQQVGRYNALILNYPDQTNPGVTFRFAYASDTSNWTGEVFLVGYLESDSHYLLRTNVGYKVIEDLKLMAGADIYGGNENKTFGALKDRSAVFFEGKYLF